MNLDKDLEKNPYISPCSSGLVHSFFFFKGFIYLFDRQRSQVGREADREREEAGSPLSREPNAGLDPRTLRS